MNCDTRNENDCDRECEEVISENGRNALDNKQNKYHYEQCKRKTKKILRRERCVPKTNGNNCTKKHYKHV